MYLLLTVLFWKAMNMSQICFQHTASVLKKCILSPLVVHLSVLVYERWFKCTTSGNQIC